MAFWLLEGLLAWLSFEVLIVLGSISHVFLNSVLQIDWMTLTLSLIKTLIKTLWEKIWGKSSDISQSHLQYS